MSTACAVAAYALVCGAALAQSGPARSDLEQSGDAVSDLGAIPCLSAAAWDTETSYSIVPGYRGVTTDSVNLGLDADMFELTIFTKRMETTPGRGALQPLLQRSGWWFLRAGSARLHNAGTDYGGQTYAARGYVPGARDLGARFGFERTAAEADAIVIERSELAALYDYAHGGRAGVFYTNYDYATGTSNLLVVENTVSYGFEMTHVFGDAAVKAAASRQEAVVGGALKLGDRFDEEIVYYPIREFGITVHASQVRRGITDSDGYGLGLHGDFGKFALSVSFARVDDHRNSADSTETVTIAFQMRFW